jgi:hypothetical protein
MNTDMVKGTIIKKSSLGTFLNPSITTSFSGPNIQLSYNKNTDIYVFPLLTCNACLG